jgi:hypothetical protein
VRNKRQGQECPENPKGDKGQNATQHEWKTKREKLFEEARDNGEREKEQSRTRRGKQHRRLRHGDSRDPRQPEGQAEGEQKTASSIQLKMVNAETRVSPKAKRGAVLAAASHPNV